MYGPLAHLYDNPAREVIAEATAAAASAMLADGARIIDLACGSGGVTVALARRGYDVVGVDRSVPMLALAQSRARGAEVDVAFVESDIRGAIDVEPADAVLIVGDVINHLLDEADVRATFANARGLLREGGVLIVDSSTRSLFESSLWNCPPVSIGDDIVMSATFDPAAGLGRLHAREGATEDVIVERYHAPHRIRAWLDDAGFEAITATPFDPIDLTQAHPDVGTAKRLWCARRPQAPRWLGIPSRDNHDRLKWALRRDATSAERTDSRSSAG